MDTPTAPDPGAFASIYGNGERSINRRAIIGAAGIAVIAPSLARAEPQSPILPDRKRIKALRWDGRARIAEKDTIIDLSVQTRVEPFVRATSRSWITRQGSWTARTMTIERDAGFVERDGKRSPMPVAQATHERQQFEIYGFMLDALTQKKLGRIDLPPPDFTFTNDKLLSAASYRVATPDGRGTFEERFVFEGLAERSNFWPGKMTMTNPDFTFTLWFDVFGVERN